MITLRKLYSKKDNENGEGIEYPERPSEEIIEELKNKNIFTNEDTVIKTNKNPIVSGNLFLDGKILCDKNDSESLNPIKQFIHKCID